VVIDQPEIVNGLQTTQEIFDHFIDGNPQPDDARNVLIRVIVPSGERARNQIIKATNNQTPVNPLSLHATDRLHFDIEDRLALYELFYDRRKGHYRHLRKNLAQIVSPRDLARAVIAVVLQQADDARARPQSLTNNKDKYPQVFNDDFNRDVFVACILLDRQIEAYLSTRNDLGKDERRDIRFYVDMWIVSELTGKAKPAPDDIANLAANMVSPIFPGLLNAVTHEVLATYQTMVKNLTDQGITGAADKVAKGPDFNAKILEMLEAKFPVPF